MAMYSVLPLNKGDLNWLFGGGAQQGVDDIDSCVGSADDDDFGERRGHCVVWCCECDNEGGRRRGRKVRYSVKVGEALEGVVRSRSSVFKRQRSSRGQAWFALLHLWTRTNIPC